MPPWRPSRNNSAARDRHSTATADCGAKDRRKARICARAGPVRFREQRIGLRARPGRAPYRAANPVHRDIHERNLNVVVPSVVDSGASADDSSGACSRRQRTNPIVRADLVRTTHCSLPGTRLLLTALALAWMCAGCSDVKESAYATMQDARQAGAVDHGWLPDFLPNSARSIREMHNIDTNQVWCTFEFSARDRPTLQAALSPLTVVEIRGKEVRSAGKSWWPAVLEGRLDPAAVDRAGLKVYSSGVLVVAVDWDRSRAFMYGGG
jgi:hypothetical protein